jgi:FkbM family methyltransferase
VTVGTAVQHLRDWLWNRRRIIKRYGVRVDRRDPHVHGPVDHTLRKGIYEQAEVKAVRVFVSPQDRVLEIGAGLGIVTTLIAQVAEHVTAFEANPALRPTLERTFALNDVRPDLRMSAVATAPGPVHIAIDDTFWTSRLADNGASVEAVGFASVLEEIRPTLVIIDCEGGERELLAEPLPAHVEKVMVELHPDVIGPDGCEAIVAGLADQGFAARDDLNSADVFVAERSV